jgi:protein gp37
MCKVISVSMQCEIGNMIILSPTTHSYRQEMNIKNNVQVYTKQWGGVVVKALCYKPEGRGFDTWWGEF